MYGSAVRQGERDPRWVSTMPSKQYTLDQADHLSFGSDACHTHSSGSAQGLNTGMHDVLNLAWKLSFQLKGLTSRKIIDSYIDERKAIVQQVIDNDIALAGLTGGKKLGRFEGRKEGVEELMEEWFRDSEAKRFTIGLGIAYRESQGVTTCRSRELTEV